MVCCITSFFNPDAIPKRSSSETFFIRQNLQGDYFANREKMRGGDNKAMIIFAPFFHQVDYIVDAHQPLIIFVNYAR
jgi:hypothetical protein